MFSSLLQTEGGRLKFFAVVIAFSWTIIIAALFFNWYENESESFIQMAALEARSHAKKDILLRKWFEGLGGIYVPVADKSTNTPFLFPHSSLDGVGSSGKNLTFLNPIYAIRTLQEFENRFSHIQSRITSLKPTKPETAPNGWEKIALQAINKETLEFFEVDRIASKPCLRLMAGLITEESCLKCHRDQGYKVGDIRGGVSISVPLDSYYSLKDRHIRMAVGYYSIIWFLGISGIFFGFIFLRREAKKTDIAEIASKSLHEQLTATLNALPDVLFEIDRDGKLVTIKGAQPESVGFPSPLPIGRNISEIFPPDVSSKISLSMEEILKNRENFGMDYSISINGNLQWFHLSMGLKKGESSRDQRFIALTRNITENKMAEEELKKAILASEAANRAKSEFLANMSHEIRTPLNAILGFSGLLTAENPREDQSKYLEIIFSRSKDLLSIFSEILDLAKIEADKIEIQKKPINVSLLLDEIKQLFQKPIEEKGLEFVKTVSPLIPKILIGDSLRIRQILWNLVGNAVKFTAKGKIEVQVTLVEKKDVNKDLAGDFPVFRLHFLVADTGIGIPAEWHENIFLPFTQVDGSSSRQYGGTGLGLTICKRLIDKMNGKLWLESTPGKGSRFHFELDFSKDAQFVHSSIDSQSVSW